MSLSREAKKGYLFSAVLFIGVIAALILSRGGPGGADRLLDTVPRDAMGVLYVPDVADLGRRLETAATGLGFERRVAMFRENIGRQLGFDPLDPDALRSKGLRPDGGLVLYAPPPGRSFVAVLQVKDPGAFEATLMELLGARTGAQRGEDRQVGAFAIGVAETRGRPMAAWAYLGDAVLISAGPDCIDRITEGVLQEKGGIGEELWFGRAISATAKDAHLFAWTGDAGAARALPRAGSSLDAAALGLQINGSDLIARAWVGMDAPVRTSLDPFKVSSDATLLLDRLDPEAMAAGRVVVDLKTAWDLARVAGLPRHVDELSAQLTARGIRIDRDLIPLLGGTFVVDAGMIGQPNLDSLRRMDPRRLNPFLYLKLSVLAPITDVEKAGELMPEVASSVARAVRGRLEVVRIGGHEAYEIHYGLGKGMTFGLAGGMLVVTGGEGAYADALSRLESGGPGLADRIADPRVIQALGEEGAVAALIHVPNLIAAVQGLPAESFGGGPTGMMLRSMVELFVGPVSKLTRVMGNLSVDDHGLLGTVEIGFEPPEVVSR